MCEGADWIHLTQFYDYLRIYSLLKKGSAQQRYSSSGKKCLHVITTQI